MKKIILSTVLGLFITLGLTAQKEITVPPLSEGLIILNVVPSNIQGKTCFTVEDGAAISFYAELDFSKEKTNSAYLHSLANALNQLKKQQYTLIGLYNTVQQVTYVFQKD